MAARYPQLQLNVSSNNTSFKRSFDELALDLDSPADEQSSSGSGESSNNGSIDRHKRARSESDSSDVGGTVNGDPSVSRTSASGVASTSSGSSLSAFVAGVLPAHEAAAASHVGSSSSGLMLDGSEGSVSPMEGIEFPTPLSLESALVPPITVAPVSPPAASGHSEHYRISMERFNAFDSNISVLRHSASPVPEPISPRTSRDIHETRSVDAPSSTPEDSPPLAQRLPHSFASDATSPFDSRPRVSHRTSSPSIFPLLSSVAPHPVPSTPASQLDIAPWLDAEFMDPWRSTSPTLPQAGRMPSHISGPPDSRPGYMNASHTHFYNRTSDSEALPTVTPPRLEHDINQRRLAALREVRIALTSPLDGNELSDSPLQASDIRDGPNPRSWVDRAAESGRLPPPATGVGQSRYESTLHVLPMRPLGRLGSQSDNYERTRQEALLRLNRLHELESFLIPPSRTHDTVNGFPPAGPRSTSDPRESDENPRASWAYTRAAEPTRPHDQTFAGRRRSPSPDPQARELALLQQFIEDLHATAHRLVTTRRALAAWDNESERDDSADSRLAHARTSLSSRNDEHRVNTANGIFPPDLHQTSHPPLRPVAASYSTFSRPPTDNRSTRGRMLTPSHLRSTRPGPSNSLMSENAAELRRRTAREHLIPSLAESGLIPGPRDFPRDGPTRSPDLDNTFGWFLENDLFAPASQGSPASHRSQLNHREENRETGGQREEGLRRHSITDAEFAAMYWDLSPPMPVVRVRSSGDRNSSRGDAPGVAVQTSGDTHSSGVDFWRRWNNVDTGTTTGVSSVRPRPSFSGLADRQSIPGLVPSTPRATSNPLGHGPPSRPSHLPDAAVPSSNEAAALFASGPSYIHGSNSQDLFGLEVNRRRRSSRLAVLRRLRADSTSDGDTSSAYASSGAHQSSADPRDGRNTHSQDRMELYLNEGPESPSSLESSARLSPSPPLYLSRADPLGPAHLFSRDLISPREIANTRTSARRFHDHIDLDSFHDGPFRATLERSIEMDRQRQARHLGSNVQHRGSEASVLPPIHSEQEARSAASVGSLPPVNSLPRFVPHPPHPACPSQLANNTTTRSSWRSSRGDVTERPIQRSQVSFQQQPVGSEWSESTQTRYSENYDQTSQAENLGSHEPIQRMIHRDRASQESHLHLHGPLPPHVEERHLPRQDFARQASRRRTLEWPRSTATMGDNESIESRGRRRNDASSGIFARSNGDGSSRPIVPLQPQARDRPARLLATTAGRTASMASSFHDFMDMLPSPPRHSHSPSVSPTRDNETAEARAAHARSTRMRATRRRHAELIGHDATRVPTELSRFGFMPPFASFRGRSIGDYVRDEDLDTSYEGLLHLSNLLGEVRPRGTPDHIVSSLPSGLYKDWATPGETEQRCPICLDDYQADDSVLKVADCTHWFHKSCLEQWLKTARTCPVCRGRVGSSTRQPGLHQRQAQTTGANRSMSGAFTARRLGARVAQREPMVRNDHTTEPTDDEGVQTPRLRNTPPWRSE